MAGAAVLRYGFFYGPGTWYDRDATIATMLRKRRHPLIGNDRARGAVGGHPRPWRDGFAEVFS